MSRKFGVEIECINANYERIIPLLRAAGITVKYDGYTHSTVNRWKIVTDGSLQGRNAYELVSPPLSGEAGLLEVEKVCSVLVKAGVAVNNSCGLHIHIDANDISIADIKSLVYRYTKYENKIDKLMPKSRRVNKFCKPMKSIAEMLEHNVDATPAEMINRIVGRNDRYWKLNLASFLRHGTVEFRQHSGTINKEKIRNWILFCLHFVEASKVKSISSSEQTSYEEEASQIDPLLDQKLAIIKSLCDTGNAHLIYLLNPFNLSELHKCLKQLADDYLIIFQDIGYNKIISTASVGRLHEIYQILSLLKDGVNPNQPITNRIIFPHTNTNDSLYTGMPPQVVNYFEEREMELSEA